MIENDIKNDFLRIPKYIQIKERLKSEIDSGVFKPGDRLPSRAEMIAKYNLSGVTASKAMDELVNEGYVCRVQGRGTFVAEPMRKSLTIALVTLHITHPNITRDPLADRGNEHVRHSIGQFVDPIEEEARLKGANINLHLSRDNISIERELLQKILADKPDGVIICYAGDQQNLDCLYAIQEAGIPLVMIDRHIAGFDCNYVTTDNYQGAYFATKALLDRGFAPLIHVTRDETASSTIDKTNGFKKVLTDAGSFSDDLIKTIHPTYDFEEETHLALNNLTGYGENFGVFTTNASSLYGIWETIQDNNLADKNIGLACFDELPIFLPENISVVNVIQPWGQMGVQAVRVVLDAIAGNTKTQHIEIPPKIRIIKGETILAENDLAHV